MSKSFGCRLRKKTHQPGKVVPSVFPILFSAARSRKSPFVKWRMNNKTVLKGTENRIVQNTLWIICLGMLRQCRAEIRRLSSRLKKLNYTSSLWDFDNCAGGIRPLDYRHAALDRQKWRETVSTTTLLQARQRSWLETVWENTEEPALYWLHWLPVALF